MLENLLLISSEDARALEESVCFWITAPSTRQKLKRKCWPLMGSCEPEHRSRASSGRTRFSLWSFPLKHPVISIMQREGQPEDFDQKLALFGWLDLLLPRCEEMET